MEIKTEPCLKSKLIPDGLKESQVKNETKKEHFHQLSEQRGICEEKRNRKKELLDIKTIQ